MEGKIILDFQKSTKITLTRYLDVMERMISNKIDGPIQFLTLPNQTQLFHGWIDIQTGTPNNLLVFKLKMHCKRMTSENSENLGEITLHGTERLGMNELTFNLCLLKDFRYNTQEDLMVIPWQEITIKLPPTHLTVQSRVGSFRLDFGNNFSRWVREEVIQERVYKIKEKREVQKVAQHTDKYGNRSGQGADFDPNIKPPSAPMVPTPYVCQKEETSTNRAWVHENQTGSGGHIQRINMLPNVGVQLGPHCVKYHNDLSGVTEPPCIGNMGASHGVDGNEAFVNQGNITPTEYGGMKAIPGVCGPEVTINQGMNLDKGWIMYGPNARIPTPPSVQPANQYRLCQLPIPTPQEFQPNRNKDQLTVKLNTADDTSLQKDRGVVDHTSPGVLTYLGAKPKTRVYTDCPGYIEPHHSPLKEQQRIWSECIDNKTVEGLVDTRSGDPRMDVIQGPVDNNPTLTPPRDVEQYMDGIQVQLYNGPIHGPHGPTHRQYREGYKSPVYSGPNNTTIREVVHCSKGYTGQNPTKPVIARGQTRHTHGTYQSLEQKEYIQQLSSNKDSNNTAKEIMMKNISDQLKGMGLQEIRRFEENLPATMSQVRQSKRLQGVPPETIKTTGNPVEDGRLLFKGDGVHFRK